MTLMNVQSDGILLQYVDNIQRHAFRNWSCRIVRVYDDTADEYERGYPIVKITVWGKSRKQLRRLVEEYGDEWIVR